MRLCTSLPLCLAVASVALLPVLPAHAHSLPTAHARPAQALPAGGVRPAVGTAHALAAAGPHRAVRFLPAAAPRPAAGPLAGADVRPAVGPLPAEGVRLAARSRSGISARLRSHPGAVADPGCVGASDRDFPLATRIHGGPETYEAGGGFGTWYLDLTSTARGTCTDVHPVVVLADDQRALRPDQPELDFYDGARPLPVRLEATDEKELVGVFDADDFDGFTVAPGRTVTVKVRLAFSGDAVPNRITAGAALVRREGEDGEWVGESAGYRFAIGDGGSTVDQTPFPPAFPSRSPSAQTGSPAPDTAVGGDVGTGRPTSASSSAPEAGDAASGTGTSSAAPPGLPDPSASGSGPATSLPFGEDAQQAGQAPDQLAATGSTALTTLTEAALGAAAAGLAGLGGGLLLAARRRR